MCIGSIYRAKIVHRISAKDATCTSSFATLSRSKSLADYLNYLGSDIEPALWASVEICIGIVSACLPTLRPVLNLVLHGTSRNKHERRFSDESEDSLEKPKRKIPKRSYLDSLGFTRLTAMSVDEGTLISKDRPNTADKEGARQTVEEDV